MADTNEKPTLAEIQAALDDGTFDAKFEEGPEQELLTWGWWKTNDRQTFRGRPVRRRGMAAGDCLKEEEEEGPSLTNDTVGEQAEHLLAGVCPQCGADSEYPFFDTQHRAGCRRVRGD